MYGAERQQLLAQRARRDGRIDVMAAAEELAVAPETIRRDLGALERQGLVRRVYGGAIPVERLDFEPGVSQRDQTNAAEKERIARAAFDLLPNRGTLLLDAGTTTGRLAGMLPADREFTVVTNSLPVAGQLAGRNHCTVHMLGGRIRGTTLASVESWALDVLDGLTVDVGFFGTNGFSVDRGCTTPDTAESAVKAAMVRACRRRVLLADHSKYGDDQFSRFAELSEIDVLITDSGLDEAAVAELSAQTEVVAA
ncbi:DeoR family transcriptional regulator [Saccharopolyspora erythraea NRRL 2338]|uniref:Lactose phosphotransferase system repressor n=2 Tax=Saccharopolyspora erythraea TaxID=1836 RepID=A4FC02_SACEN|nr:DeoR/GlpR family DNA-binding transcription regulator [Saccharopolyspora erythraea]EQD84071.1 D-beta-D-heptose 1-phosphate adenosyltransferase [Saccharopolyspora erythraea D]PFG95349.1 DeoR family transcriptional regulator [Saccharopolyspora erythraea NRRL 2338]QRK91991.1 DeoR/GlpR transcriptional regulator [Saccharopolyspora erythraea]CAM01577.1 transcriptional regulator, DeoR family [Saccharopolyspora erythraea NRRL 2338]